MRTLPRESEEDRSLRDIARDIATRCEETRAADGGHEACWRALVSAGLHELRDDVDGGPAATTAQCVVVVEELARTLCGAPLMVNLLARELSRLAGVPQDALVDEALTVLLTPELDGVGSVDTGLAIGVAGPVRRALGVRAGELVVVDLGDAEPTQDLSRSFARPAGDAVPLGVHPEDQSWRNFESFARVLLAADLLGAASAVFESAVDYAQQRVQFGQVIGAFQAVQHLCARAHVQLEALRSTILFACWAIDADDEPATAAIVAKAYAGRAGVAVAETATQVFGGVAITWEFPAHRHLRRTLLDAATLGSPDALGALLLEETAAHGLH
jgi:alkylation response protein AidB-like acyl-CoA dehydrogenase